MRDLMARVLKKTQARMLSPFPTMVMRIQLLAHPVVRAGQLARQSVKCSIVQKHWAAVMQCAA